MRYLICSVLFILLCFVNANAAVIDFDDLAPNPSGIGTGSSGNTFGWLSGPQANYGGFDWGSFWAYGNPQSEPAISISPTSGSNLAINGYVASTMSITRNSSFNFIGAYLGNYSSGSNFNMDVFGYSNGVLLYSETIALSDNYLSWFAFNYLGVDQIVFRMGHDLPLAMDNFTYSEPSDSVPEPSTFLLAGAGFLGIILMRRRKAA